jgi:PHD/YefM family antitoxin component YafN of YafNO toxin-antitoxin module
MWAQSPAVQSRTGPQATVPSARPAATAQQAIAATGSRALSALAVRMERVSEAEFSVQAEEQPSWPDIVRHAERGESVAVIAHGHRVAEIIPSGELDRLRETIEVLSDSELARDLQEGLADARAGRVSSLDQLAADLAARRAAGE